MKHEIVIDETRMQLNRIQSDSSLNFIERNFKTNPVQISKIHTCDFGHIFVDVAAANQVNTVVQASSQCEIPPLGATADPF